MPTITEQIRNNAVALISLFIAVGSLGYNTWRNETTEYQRNIRHAAFRTLEELAELQTVVDQAYYFLPGNYSESRADELRIRGYGSALLIRDLMSLMPGDAPAMGGELSTLWNGHVDVLTAASRNEASKRSEQALSAAIKQARHSLVEEVLPDLE